MVYHNIIYFRDFEQVLRASMLAKLTDVKKENVFIAFPKMIAKKRMLFCTP